MHAFAFLAMVVIVGQDAQRHPLAPSLPLLTKAEYEKIDAIIERFILADTGKIKGAEAKKALDDFNKLGPEAIFNLIDGFNRAANMESSCPAVIIAKKVNTILTRSDDKQLLIFAKDNLGAGVTAKRHSNVLQDLRFSVLQRQSYLQRRDLASKGAAKVSAWSLADLEKAIAAASGPQLKTLLIEVEKRNGAKAVDLLAKGLASSNAEIAKLSQGLLAKNLQHQSGDVLKAMLKHDRREVQLAAAQVVGTKKLRYGAELIAMIEGARDSEVAQAARRALVQIAGGVDHDVDVARWRAWWNKQK